VVVSLGYKLKKAQCEVDIQCDPKLSIYSFPGSFTQIYSNLILNSIHHGFDGWDRPKKITIQVAQQGDELVIDYSDNGRGIPGDLPRIFDPFVTSKRGQGGSGLGTPSSTTWWSSCCAAASTAPANRARVPSSTFACPSSRTEHRLLWAGRFIPIML
jgi:phosphoglycerate-specific signal transduction histidine kinase